MESAEYEDQAFGLCAATGWLGASASLVLVAKPTKQGNVGEIWPDAGGLNRHGHKGQPYRNSACACCAFAVGLFLLKRAA